MKIIIPMAGRGSRLRPHTLTVPKPLIPIAGKPIVQRLVEGIADLCENKIDEIAFIIGDFGEAVEIKLNDIANSLGAKCSIYYQEEALGTAHAVFCAKESLKGNVVVAFADTLFKADFKFNETVDGTIWVKQIDDPSAFGVVKINEQNIITDFIEKPKDFISDLAIIGIYHFKSGENLLSEIQYLIDNDIKDKGEYQLTNALENMKTKGMQFSPGKVDEWLDCGNKDVTVNTNQKILTIEPNNHHISKSANVVNSTIIPPCFIGENVEIKESVIGPFVSIGDNTNVKRCNLENSIIQENSHLSNANFNNSMVGNYAEYHANSKELSIGDYTTFSG